MSNVDIDNDNDIDIDIESDEPIYERPSEIPKDDLYQLLFDAWLTYKDVAALCETGRGIQVATVCRMRGVPTIKHKIGDTENIYVFRRRPKSLLYEQYWVEGLSQQEIGDHHTVSKKMVNKRMRNESIPVDSSGDFADDRFYDDGDGAPTGFGFEPSDSDDDSDALPDDPNPSKYLADYPEYDAEWLYEMHWGYGLSVHEMTARTENFTHYQTLVDEFEKRGIPYRQHTRHYHWEPHKGVPAKFEWTDGEPSADDSDSDSDSDTVDADVDVSEYDDENDFRVAAWRKGLATGE